MFRNLSFKNKIISLVVTLVLLAVFAAGYTTYVQLKSTFQEKYINTLSSLNDLKVEKIYEYIGNIESNIDFLSKNDVFKAEEAGSDETAQMSDDFGGGMEEDLSAKYDEVILPMLTTLNAENIHVTDANGAILYSAKYIEAEKIISIPGKYDDEIVERAKQGIAFTKIYKNEDDFYFMVGNTIAQDGDPQMIFMEMNLSPLFKLIQNDLSLGETVESFMVRKVDERAIVQSPLKFKENAELSEGPYYSKDEWGYASKDAAEGNSGSGKTIDYRRKEALAVWNYIPKLNIGLVSKIDLDEIDQSAMIAVQRYAMYGVVILLFALVISLVVAQYFTNPLHNLQKSFTSLSEGELPEKIDKVFNDEIGKITESTNNFVGTLNELADFTTQIGQGNLDANYQPISEKDVLGNALIDMRDSLKENEEKDKQRNWIVTGVAEISEILRSHNTIEGLGDELIAYVTNRVDAIQGAFYVVDGEKKDRQINMKAAYAYNKKKYLNGTFKFAEGLVGQAAAEQDIVLRTEIPGNYVSVTSGLLGDKKPECILISPMITNEEVFGVFEFASFHKFGQREIEYVKEISTIVARTIFNIQVNDRTRRLLEESQKMSSELQEQQEILRQNAEEMEATQEELKRTNQRLEDQIEEVNRTQNRMQLLLENASEVISIYEENQTVRYISPSVERILGYQFDEIVGKKDKEFLRDGDAEIFDKMFQAVLDNSFESSTVQYEYVKKNGDTIWVEATATNLLSDPAIQGIIVNTRDITERKRAEQEERMRSKMQSLSENSPDLITRLDTEGTFFYINPVIEQFTGQKPSELLHKSIGEVQVEEVVKDKWKDILKEVEEESKTITKEIDFPSELIGDRVVQVNAIPEYDENEQMESVLMVSHDITERKQIELEIQNKNKKITESINYAKRIQGAILPDNTVIKRFLPGSFILYKAKDVVSGDFPWFLKMGDLLYFAAVDCTGHGVPGALISLIGYFSLNEVVKGRKIDDPGEILDQLDASITTTLRQDEADSKTKDGMDIALCKIDVAKKEVTYAGAHRPLYVMKDGEMQEIKGNKFPIGGGVYKNQTNFTSTTVKLSEGDSVFFCSDGFPDQFGGPDNRKFGPKRLRTLISENFDKSADELYNLFDVEWENWKGDQKQTDDVLLIGMKF